MSDERPPMPKQPTTVQLPAVPDWAIELTKSVKEGLAGLDAKVDTLTENVELLQHDAKDTRLRLGRMERELDEVKARNAKHSVGARQLSETDAKHDAAIGMLHTKVDRLEEATEAQTKILTKLESGASKLAANPLVRSIATMIGTAILTWLAAHGGVK